MNQDIVHVYFMPGMAASPKIFEHIQLPENQFKMHFLQWIIPLKNEGISAYALRICSEIQHQNPILVGVSFGGVLVQEMSKHIHVKKLIIVSSVKSYHELPKRMKLIKLSKAYKIIPYRLVSDIDRLAKYAFGETITKRVELYKKYLAVNDAYYLSWAIKEMVCWNQEEPLMETIHIHGMKDKVFPFSLIKNTIAIKNGTHIMIINKYKWFNENLPKLILDK